MGGLSNSIAPSEYTPTYALNPNRKIIEGNLKIENEDQRYKNEIFCMMRSLQDLASIPFNFEEK